MSTAKMTAYAQNMIAGTVIILRYSPPGETPQVASCRGHHLTSTNRCWCKIHATRWRGAVRKELPHTMTHNPHRFIAALIAATDWQPIAGLLAALVMTHPSPG
jgi:hypothetical protein